MIAFNVARGAQAAAAFVTDRFYFLEVSKFVQMGISGEFPIFSFGSTISSIPQKVSGVDVINHVINIKKHWNELKKSKSQSQDEPVDASKTLRFSKTARNSLPAQQEVEPAQPHQHTYNTRSSRKISA